MVYIFGGNFVFKKKTEDKRNFEEAVAKCEEHKNIIYKLNLT
jgi:hypothetical protein